MSISSMVGAEHGNIAGEEAQQESNWQYSHQQRDWEEFERERQANFERIWGERNQEFDRRWEEYHRESGRRRGGEQQREPERPWKEIWEETLREHAREREETLREHAREREARFAQMKAEQEASYERARRNLEDLQEQLRRMKAEIYAGPIRSHIDKYNQLLIFSGGLDNFFLRQLPTLSTIKSFRRQLNIRTHPDKNDGKTEDLFKNINIHLDVIKANIEQAAENKVTLPENLGFTNIGDLLNELRPLPRGTLMITAPP
ncbi:hypothetical protein M3P05_17250 [Sansalvadorimonas sp. 2012CJ34-2]|uniref:J domain-containing protein n=1 Tax=Parendozoicomonas callyspongiae TaxID=2942213 RepID=A0ABT0PJV8_9GAMM|nr:hypothetical protein [Sansalvadorimonas sp. 2012CJ34-2]MCL6271667.1 hypothetical protein [Sansalvadorimonas sp. 2012CJ34-2]